MVKFGEGYKTTLWTCPGPGMMYDFEEVFRTTREKNANL
jgi:hypothetical protein